MILPNKIFGLEIGKGKGKHQEKITQPTKEELIKSFEEFTIPYTGKNTLSLQERKEIFQFFEDKYQGLEGNKNSEEKFNQILFKCCKKVNNQDIINFLDTSKDKRLIIKYLNYLLPQDNIESFGIRDKKTIITLKNGSKFLLEDNHLQKTIQNKEGNIYEVITLGGLFFENAHVWYEKDGEQKKSEIFIENTTKKVLIKR